MTRPAPSRRTLGAVLLSAVLTMGLVACSTNDQDSNAGASSAPSALSPLPSVDPSTTEPIVTETPATPPLPEQYSDVNAYAAELEKLVNDAREQVGLPPLMPLECLDALALDRARSAITADALKHEPLIEPCDSSEKAAENLVRATFSPGEAVDRWLNSGGHAANILDPELVWTSVGCVAFNDQYAPLQPGEVRPIGMLCSQLFLAGPST